MRHSCLIAALFLMFASEPARAQGSVAIIPAEWLPALAPSIESALAEFKAAESQPQMNSLSRQIAEMRDAQLFIAYVRLYERLGEKEREKLRKEQTAWLKTREKAGRAAIESEGGSLAPLEANNAEVTLTEKRLVELRARLKTAAK